MNVGLILIALSYIKAYWRTTMAEEESTSFVVGLTKKTGCRRLINLRNDHRSSIHGVTFYSHERLVGLIE